MNISEQVAFLEMAYDRLNHKFFESALPKVAITIQSTPKTHGHFTPWNAWRDGDQPLKEINLGAESLKRPMAETIATLIHEMVHYHCFLNGVKDVSRNGTYHNKRFKVEAESRGLIISQDPGVGYNHTQPSKELIEFISMEGWLDKEMMFRNKHPKMKKGAAPDDEDVDPPKKPSSTRKYCCPICNNSVRATKNVRIACMECNNAEMILAI